MAKLLNIPKTEPKILNYKTNPGWELLWEMHCQDYIIFINGHVVEFPDPVAILKKIDMNYLHNDFTASLKQQGPPYTWNQVRALRDCYHRMENRAMDCHIEDDWGDDDYWAFKE